MARGMVEERSRSESRKGFRLRVSRRESPLVLGATGLMVILLALANLAIPPRGQWYEYVLTIGVGLGFIVVSVLIRRGSVPLPLVPWVFSGMGVLLTGLLLIEYVWDSRSVNLAWVIAVMLAFVPLVGDRAAGVTGAVLALGLFTVCVLAQSVPSGADFLLVAGASVIIGLLLLHRRLATLDALCDAEDAAEESARSDALTGLLNRRGLVEHLDGLAALARRTSVPMFAVLLDVRGLKAANDRHGHPFGDLVISTVAEALRSITRASDLLCRWGGDEFVVVGVGDRPTPAELEGRIAHHVIDSGIDISWWDGQVTVGVAADEAGSVQGAADALALIAAADAEMYRRRAESEYSAS